MCAFEDAVVGFLTIMMQTYIAKSKAPLLINSCEIDPQFPQEFAKTADEKFAKYEHGYKRTYWEGCQHGLLFAETWCVFLDCSH